MSRTGKSSWRNWHEQLRTVYAGLPQPKAGCSASCEAWNAVKGERLKSYGRRAEIIDISQMTDGGARNCRRAARGKRKIGGEM